MRRLHEYIAENMAIRFTERTLQSMGGEDITVTKGHFRASFPDMEKAEQVVAMFEEQDFKDVEIRLDDPTDDHFVVEWTHK